MSFSDVFINRLYPRHFFEHDLPGKLPPVQDAPGIFARLESIRKGLIPDGAEANIDIFFSPEILRILGWQFVTQENFLLQEKPERPDFMLFGSREDINRFTAAPDAAKPYNLLLSVWEDKKPGVPLDTGKTDKKLNPYFQLLEYLSFLRLPYGFMTNGHEIWYVDNSEIFAEKRYLALNFDRLVESRDVNALRIFLGVFGLSGHVGEKQSLVSEIAQESGKYRRQTEDELAMAIYGLNGQDSFFEKCGEFLFEGLPNREGADLGELYKNSLYLTFRLIFIAFFEARHREILEKHSGYSGISLASIYRKTRQMVLGGNTKGYESWNALQTLFHALDQGNENLDIPLFNGGLFSPAMATLLEKAKLLDNGQILYLLSSLNGEGSDGVMRDFADIGVIQLGRIYESLLEFEFRIAEENLWHLEYKEKQGESIEGYFDTEEYHNIKAGKSREITGPVREYKKGQLYMVGGRNSRKRSASYYTPSSLARPLARQAIDQAVANLADGQSLLDLRILDNACGSGHLLVEALRHLTRLALTRIEEDRKLKVLLEEEKGRIEAETARYFPEGQAPEVDELAVLKRILLKKTIYGVDLQFFAVELARLSLWMETFIFGTPLSFIEHHVKAGNSLIGASLEKVSAKLVTDQGSLVAMGIASEFKELAKVFSKLSALQDTTAENITHSKDIYEKEIKPELEKLNKSFNLLNTARMLLAEKKADAKMLERAKNSTSGQALLNRNLPEGKEDMGGKILSNFEKLAEDLQGKKGNWQELDELVGNAQRKYGFFNWEIEFPEAFQKGDRGFHVIIGNPPWEKTKFSDPDFFSFYRSNYRQLSNSQKAETAADLLHKPSIASRYLEQQKTIIAENEYYREHFPLCAGSGDGNLFRFFVEKNLSLLARNGTLNYVIPTALWTDEGSTGLRREIFEKRSLISFYGFENREKLFPAVDTRYKFGLTQIGKSPEQAGGAAKVAFMLTSPASLEDQNNFYAYSAEDVRNTSPRWFALMELPGRPQLDVMAAIHKSGFPYLDPEWLDFRNELHATSDKKIFQEKYRQGMIPLYKGACIWQFDSCYQKRGGDGNKNDYWLDPVQFDQHLVKKERERIVEDVYPLLPKTGKESKKAAVLKALGLKKTGELDQYIMPDRLFPRLAFRDIASDTNERSMIASVIPANIGCQNTLWVAIPKRYIYKDGGIAVAETGLKKLFFAQALFNSLVFDWVIRASIAIHVNKTYIWRVPMPQPEEEAISQDAVFRLLASNSLRLSAFYNEEAFYGFFTAFGLAEKDRILTEKIAGRIRRQNDALIARLYGLDRTALEIMLGSFRVMNRNSPGYGKALLEEFSALGDSGQALPHGQE